MAAAATAAMQCAARRCAPHAGWRVVFCGSGKVVLVVGVARGT